MQKRITPRRTLQTQRRRLAGVLVAVAVLAGAAMPAAVAAPARAEEAPVEVAPDQVDSAPAENDEPAAPEVPAPSERPAPTAPSAPTAPGQSGTPDEPVAPEAETDQGAETAAPEEAPAAQPFAAPAPFASAPACMPTAGIGTVHPANPSKPQPVDGNANVYVGGDYTRTTGAELEGQLVVRGNARFEGSAGYNIGWAGAGSGLIPAADSTALRVGGDVHTGSGSGSTLIVGTVDAANAPKPVHVRVGGRVTGSGSISLQHTGSTTATGLGRDSALGSPAFSNWAANNHAVLRQTAESNEKAGTAGTVVREAGGFLTLNGARGATRHLFVIDASDLGTQGWVLNLGANIQPSHPIVIKVTGSQPTVNIQDVWFNKFQHVMGSERFGQAAAQILWTFPTAKQVTIGGAHVPGSIIVPTPDATTTVTANSTNGRLWVAGNLTQKGAGSEFHAFPFIGDPSIHCDNPVGPEDPNVPVQPPVPDTCDANTFYALQQQGSTAASFHKYRVDQGDSIRKISDGVLAGSYPRGVSGIANGLGMTPEGNFFFTAQNGRSIQAMRADKNTQGGVDLAKVGGSISIPSNKTIVAGAVESESGDFYFGYYDTENGRKRATLHVYRTSTSPTTGTARTEKLLAASIVTSVNMSGNWGNGDFAFDTNGNLHFVLSSSTSNSTAGQAVVGSLSKTQLASTGSVSTTTSSAQRNPLSETGGFNGMAYLGSGKMVAEQGVRQIVAEPGTLKPLGNASTGNPTNLVDLASCASPPTLTVQKNVIDRVQAGDQFQLELLSGGTLINEETTTGSKAGIQAEKIENVPVEAGAKYRVRESFPVADNTKMYQSSLACVQDPSGAKTPLATTPVKAHEWDITIPSAAGASGVEVRCTITNDPLHPNLAISKSADPVSGTAVQAGQKVTYTVTFENTGRGEARVKHVDHLADVLDDATFDAKSLRYGDGAGTSGRPTPMSPGITGEFTAADGKLAITGTVPAGAKRTISYTVTVLPDSENSRARQAQVEDGEPHGYTMRNFVTTAGKTPPTECAPKPGEPVTCTEHPIPAWDIVKSAQPPNKASLHTGGNVYYNVAIRNFSGAPLSEVRLSDDITEVMRVATWDPDAPRLVAKVQGVRFLNADGQQVDQDGDVMQNVGRPGANTPDGPDSLPYEVVTAPVHQNSTSRSDSEDPRRGSWTLDTEAFDIPQGVVRAEVSYAVQVGSPADPADPTQPWHRDGVKVPAEPMAVFDNFVAGTSSTRPPLSCEIGTDVTKDPSCQTRHQLGDGYFHIQKNSTAADPNKPGSVQWNLQGVEFEIRDTPNGGPTKALCDASKDPACAEFYRHTDDSDGQAAGSWHASNLPEGDYYLVETQAAEGHQLLAEPIRFHVGPAAPGQPLGQGKLGIYKPGIRENQSFDSAAGHAEKDFFLPACEAPSKLPSTGGPACVMPTGWLMQVYDPKLLPLPMSGGLPPITLYAGGALLALGAALWIRRSLRSRNAA